MIRFLRLKDVILATGLSKTAVWEKVRHDPDFPKPVKPLGPGTKPTAWVEGEITAYQEKRIAERDAKIAAKRGKAA